MNKRIFFAADRQWFAGRAWALLLALLSIMPACTEVEETVGEALPSPSTELNATYTDTITVRTSTVLTDSVPSSATNYLLAGRYLDSPLGTLVARSYVQVGLSGAFTPDPALRYDSLVLAVTADAYRYGDTTRTQQLEVHRQTQTFQATKTYFTADALSYDDAVLGRRSFRAGAHTDSLRIRLDNALGQELWQAGQNGQLTTYDEVKARLKGLVLAPGSADNAALMRWSAAAGATHLYMYYHDPAAPTEALVYAFPVAGDYPHFFQLSTDRTGTALASLSNTRQGISSAATQEEVFIQAGLGLKTKLEFPYLAQLKELGGIIIINSAQLSLETITSANNRFLPPPAALYPRLTNRANQNGSYFLTSAGTIVTLPYQKSTSARTGLEQGSYVLGMTTYVQDVLRGTLVNDGILLGTETTGSTERTLLGSARNTAHPLRLRLYFTRVTR
ncbi:DUF4270 family protein [Hymenobacter lucidus]|uniref:DUF4270 domain-containing protein n=1 Tax=Hymenobacter lucidus TaxID=2880930 RepID=A0ABS8AVJ1_9BACT|nr:DUF4270 family protein [Hymenobacter lucidus]MCB2409916.1 DUF4270 domain-containing protein [Hymenobacter lucidus]